ncbi:MAG: metallophosphoesterase, partial [Muribaculaceae bacterium]|nr:metallophosphoesterase [Muribaculaceae bacterium]
LVAAEKPDIVAMTGDMLSHKAPNTEEFLRLTERLAKISSVYYVNGNHELSDLSEEDFEYVAETLAACGAVCLDNDYADISRGNDTIRICGLCYSAEYYRGVREYKRGWKAFMLTDMIDYLGLKDPEVFTVLLAHNPLDFDVHAEWGADLSLGGHVHGGLIRLPVVNGIFSPERKIFPKYKEGVYNIGNSYLIASRGLGRFRVHNPPEIVSVTLFSK